MASLDPPTCIQQRQVLCPPQVLCLNLQHSKSYRNQFRMPSNHGKTCVINVTAVCESIESSVILCNITLNCRTLVSTRIHHHTLTPPITTRVLILGFISCPRKRQERHFWSHFIKNVTLRQLQDLPPTWYYL